MLGPPSYSPMGSPAEGLWQAAAAQLQDGQPYGCCSTEQASSLRHGTEARLAAD